MSFADMSSVATYLRDALEGALWLSALECQCVTASLLAIPIVRVTAPELDWQIAWGAGHCWVESDEGHVVDLTHAQYDAKRPVRVLNPYEAATERYTAQIRLKRSTENWVRDRIEYREYPARLHSHLPPTKFPIRGILSTTLQKEHLK